MIWVINSIRPHLVCPCPLGAVLLWHTSSVTRIDSLPALFILHWLSGQLLPKPNHKVCYWSRAVPAGRITRPVLFNFIQSRLPLLPNCVRGTEQPVGLLLGTPHTARTREKGNKQCVINFDSLICLFHIRVHLFLVSRRYSSSGRQPFFFFFFFSK